MAVSHGLAAEPLGEISIANWWDPLALEPLLIDKPGSWIDLLQRARSDFDKVILSSPIETVLSSYPFDRVICDRVLTLVGILQRIAEETDENGALSEVGIETFQQFFVGKKAPFSDESDTNKHAFRQSLTFPDPSNPTARIFCPWHGKIRREQFRIHFEWERPLGQQKIKVVYVGPKITKA